MTVVTPSAPFPTPGYSAAQGRRSGGYAYHRIMAATGPTFRRMPLREAFRAAPAPVYGTLRLVGPGGVLASKVDVAATPMRRVRGLLGRAPLEPGEAFVIQPCSQVHTVGMRYAIDAVFCDRDGRVLAVFELEPGRMSRIVRRSWCCIEMHVGTARTFGVVEGATLRLERIEGPTA